MNRKSTVAFFVIVALLVFWQSANAMPLESEFWVRSTSTPLTGTIKMQASMTPSPTHKDEKGSTPTSTQTPDYWATFQHLENELSTQYWETQATYSETPVPSATLTPTVTPTFTEYPYPVGTPATSTPFPYPVGPSATSTQWIYP